jgi:hypothetical protein
MPVKNLPYDVSYYAEDLQNGGGITGDGTNHTLRLLVDGVPLTPSGDITEPDSTNLKGWYVLEVHDDENTGDIMVMGGESSTGSVAIRGTQWFNEQYLAIDTQKQVRKEIERLYGINPLSLYGDGPLIEPSESNPDENNYATWPSVFYDSGSGVYRMYYTARLPDNSAYCISHRESADGKTNWSDPVQVLTSGAVPGEWEHYGPWAPVVWQEDGYWQMLYTSRDEALTQTSIGYASGEYALDFTKHPNNPILTPSEDWELGSCEVTGLIKRNDIYHLFYVTLSGSHGSGKTFPAYTRKVGYASGVAVTNMHKQSTPVFGDADDSYDNQPYHGYYSASPFWYGNLYYLVIARYAPSREDYTQFELWSCYDPNFPINTRKRVSMIQTTNSWGEYPNEDIDIISFASDNDPGIGIDRAFDNNEEFRMYFGTAHTPDNGSRTWATALATETNVRKVLYFVPSIQTDLFNRLPSTRWDLTASGIAEYIWDTKLSNHISAGSAGQALITASGNLLFDDIKIYGDSNWATAIGFSTHSAADVWSVGTRTLSGTVNDFDELITNLDSNHGAGSWETADITNIGSSGNIAQTVWEYGTRILTASTNFNDLSQADIRSAVGLAANNLDTQLTAIDNYVDTMEADIKSYGDSNWATATGFSTHSAADVYTAFGTGSNLTALLTATGFSTHNAADVWTAGSRSLSGTIGDFDALDTALDSAHGAGSWETADITVIGTSGNIAQTVWEYGTRILTAGTNLNDLSQADIRAAVGLSSANLDTQLTAIDNYVDTMEADIKSYGDINWATATGFSTSTQLLSISGVLQDTNTQIGTAGAGLTNIPWNSSWDSEVQSNVTSSLTSYDVATRIDLLSISGSILDVNIIQVSGEYVSISDFGGEATINAADVADAVWDEQLSDHVTFGSAGQAMITTSGILLDSINIGSGLATTRQLNNWGLILLNHLRDSGIEP